MAIDPLSFLSKLSYLSPRGVAFTKQTLTTAKWDDRKAFVPRQAQ